MGHRILLVWHGICAILGGLCIVACIAAFWRSATGDDVGAGVDGALGALLFMVLFVLVTIWALGRAAIYRIWPDLRDY